MHTCTNVRTHLRTVTLRRLLRWALELAASPTLCSWSQGAVPAEEPAALGTLSLLERPISNLPLHLIKFNSPAAQHRSSSVRRLKSKLRYSSIRLAF